MQADNLRQQKRRQHWSSVATAYADEFQEGEAGLYAELEANLLIEFTQPNPDKLILDVCSGAGRNTLALATTGARIYSADLADNMVKVARDRARQGGYDNVSCLQSNVMVLPFADDTFDAVTGTRFMYMMSKEEKKKIIAELRRVLKPGGVLALQFNGGPWGLKHEFLNVLRGGKFRVSERYLWPGQAQRLFEGMRVERVVGSKFFRLGLVLRLFGRRVAHFCNRLVRTPGLSYLSAYLVVKAVKPQV